MNLTPKQLKVQEAMLLRLYPGKSLEEARSEEIKCPWCLIYHVDLYDRSKKSILRSNKFTWMIDNDYQVSFFIGIWWSCKNNDIIWLPPTLPKVLDALGSPRSYLDWYIWELWRDWYATSIQRKLRNDDGTDATLRDQSIETQDAVGRLLGVE